MSYNNSTGVYTPASGAETAAPGQVLQSAVWNNIFTDLSTALTTIGQGSFPWTIPQPSTVTLYACPAQRNVNFAATQGDIATFAINLPTSVSFYRLNSMVVYGAAGNLNSAQVSLYTGANATGTTVIGSTVITVATSLVNTLNGVQVIPASVSTYMLNAAQLFLHVSTTTATSTTANVMLRIEPLF